MTTPHPSSAPSSYAYEHLRSLERNPIIVPSLIPQAASWNWPGTWCIALFGWICSSINTQCTPIAPSSASQEASTSEHHASGGDRDGQNIGGSDIHLETP